MLAMALTSALLAACVTGQESAEATSQPAGKQPSKLRTTQPDATKAKASREPITTSALPPAPSQKIANLP